jgi:pantoate--beta-alanine ligase
VKIICSIAEMQQWSESEHKAGNTIGFVPTMGALHVGHVNLVAHSTSEQSRTVVSIFVNPLQFNNKQDLLAYPRQLEQDTAITENCGVDVLFVPSYDEMYPAGFTTLISAGVIAQHMEGLHRPGHFDGVATVVVKLLNAVSPDVAYFGEKDFQQLAVIRQVVGDLNIPCVISGVATVRDESGLALSSRNARLTPQNLEQAKNIYSVLRELVDECRAVETLSEKVKESFVRNLEVSTTGLVEYIEIVASETLIPSLIASPGCTICVAVWFDDVRLIDNVKI